MTSVTGPEIPEELEDERKPIDLVLVVDRSGSMGGKPIELTKKTLEFVIKEMQDFDRIAVVAFDDDIEIVVDLTECTKENKEKAIEKVKGINDRGSTNLSGGLFAGLEILRKREKKADVSSVLLFTDGEANAGLQNTNEIVKMIKGERTHPALSYAKAKESIMQKYRRKKKMKKKGETTAYNYVSDNINIYTFGFGSSTNEKMLKEISTKGSGIYYYIKTNEDISEAFTDCLGGLLSIVAKKIVITFEPLNGCVLKKVQTAYPQSTNSDGCVIVKVPDLQSEEVRDMLGIMTLPKLTDENLKFKVLRTHVKYESKDGKEKTEEIMGTVMRPKEEPKEQVTNVKIDEQKNRFLCTQVIDEVKALADNNAFDKAKKRCQETIQHINASPSQNSTFCKALVSDLKEQMSGMNKRSYVIGGYKQQLECMNVGIKMQRGANLQSKSNALFENKRKRRLKAKKKSFFK